MDREELTRALIMDCIANDYEDVAMIHKEVGNWALEEHDVSLTSDEITEALMGLIEAGLVKAYRLSQMPTEELPGGAPP